MIKPVDYYKKPGYPLKCEALLDPRLLQAIPRRWNGNRYVSAALTSLLLISMTACGQKPLAEGTAGTSGPESTASIENQIAVVAPVFEHGAGRGSFGCVSIAPPAFLSEEEALQVINEEAAKAGFSFTPKGQTLKDVRIPVTNIYPDRSEQKEGDEKLLKTKAGDLELDGYDSEKQTGFEFISKDDIVGWYKQGNMMSTVEDYEMLDAARTLQNGLEGKTGETSVAVFYDPVAWIGKDGIPENANSILKNESIQWEEKEVMLKELSEEQLRVQVRDFIEWLKGEGII